MSVEQDFSRYILQDRGLSGSTLRCYLPFVSEFLRERFGNGPICFEALSTRDATGFVQRNVHDQRHGRVQMLVRALRAFLRF